MDEQIIDTASGLGYVDLVEGTSSSRWSYSRSTKRRSRDIGRIVRISAGCPAPRVMKP